MFLLSAILPAQFASAQFADLKAEVEVADWRSNGFNTWTTAVHCVVGTNCWQIDGSFSKNANITYWFTGTNLLEESVVTKDVSDDLNRELRRELKDLDASDLPNLTAPAIGTSNSRVYESRDGNPGHTVRQLDLMTMPARVSWLAFCSGPYLKREGRRLYPPSDLWKELVCTDHFVDKTITFEDTLGLPNRIDLYTTNAQELVLQYRVTSSTNFNDWEFPLSFELVQYCTAPLPGNPHVTMGTNGWQLQFVARGKVASVTEGAAPKFRNAP
jgi:hypothetical protein